MDIVASVTPGVEPSKGTLMKGRNNLIQIWRSTRPKT
jgi:hypothetical protein